MSLYKDPKSPHWQFDFVVEGVRFRGSTKTDQEQLAKGIEAKKRTEAIQQVMLGVSKKPTLTVNEACGKFWLDHARHLKSGENSVKFFLAYIKAYLGKNTLLASLDDAAIADMVAKLRGRKLKHRKQFMRPASINRVLATLSKMLSDADEKWGMEVGRVNVRKHMLPEPDHRVRWISVDEANRIIQHAASHLKYIIEFALLTGQRKSNITSLRWEQVDMIHRTITFQVKSDKPGGKFHSIEISQALYTLMKRIGPKTKGLVFVRTFKGGQKPVGLEDIKNGFNGACKRAGLSDFRFHDLRHTAATWMRMANVPLEDIQEILGHERIETTQRYAHINKEGLRKSMNALGNFMAENSRSDDIVKKRKIANR